MVFYRSPGRGLFAMTCWCYRWGTTRKSGFPKKENGMDGFSQGYSISHSLRIRKMKVLSNILVFKLCGWMSLILALCSGLVALALQREKQKATVQSKCLQLQPRGWAQPCLNGRVRGTSATSAVQLYQASSSWQTPVAVFQCTEGEGSFVS